MAERPLDGATISAGFLRQKIASQPEGMRERNNVDAVRHCKKQTGTRRLAALPNDYTHQWHESMYEKRTFPLSRHRRPLGSDERSRIKRDPGNNTPSPNLDWPFSR
jgi:hypothetical protein